MTSLPPSWEQRIIPLEDRRDLTLDDLERALRSHQAKMTDVPTQATKAFAVAKYEPRGRGRGHRGRGRGQGGRFHQRGSTEFGIRSCWYCLKTGHSQNDCFGKKKADEGRRERMKRQAGKGSESQGSSASASFADAHALMTKRESVKYSHSDWFIDSGATDHMSNEQEDFISLKRLDPSIRVVLGDDTVVYAYGMCTINLSPKVSLNRVLFVPELGTRLLSVSAVTRLGYQVIFDRFGCKIWTDNINILSASPHGNLFKVDLYHAKISKVTPTNSTNAELNIHDQEGSESQIDNVISTNSSTKQREHDVQLWHQRLGHLNVSDMR